MHPEKRAIIYKKETLTYGELDEQSNKLARLLLDAGCQKGDRICFLMPKSPAAIVSILGILKADCIYVPLDSSSPAPRISKILSSCEPKMLIIGGSVSAILDELISEGSLKCQILSMDAAITDGKNFKIAYSGSDLLSFSGEHVVSANKSEDAAHILFTSGSTGTPKGVIITHQNVIHYVDWGVKYFGYDSTDKMSAHPPLHFDLSTFDIYGTLGVGAELYQVPVELNLLPHKIADFIRTNELTQWFSVPSVLNFMAKTDVVKENDFPSLKRLLWCGEVFPTPPLIYWMKKLPNVQFTNLYGPTEATIASSYYTVPTCPENEAEQIPIGTPCDDEQLIVLDEALNPVPTGEIGDLYLAGVGLSPGYWRDEEKTKSVFLEPANSSNGLSRIYKTGDLAKVGEDGLVYYLGRVDSQIKSRGYRIELGEIETAMNSLQLTEECAVVAVNSAGFEGAIICCAYVPLKDKDVTPADLRARLSKSLPSYMMPTKWMSYEALPKNANGKIDRPKLREGFSQN